MTRIPANRDSISTAAARWVARRDAGLTAAESAELEAWLAADPRHVAALGHYTKTWSILDRPRVAEAAGAVLREVGSRERRRRQAVAATLAAVTLLAVFAPWRGRIAPPAAPPARAVVLQPERRTLTDGSIVDLKAGAAIVVNYDDTVRRVTLLGGEAHFQVVKGQPRPFVVEASGVQVRAVGTAFAVQLNRGEVEVLVTEGRVAVAKPAAPSEPEPFATLGVGDRLVVGLASPPGMPAAVTIVPAAEIAERLAWRVPRLQFSGTPLWQAVALMNGSASPANPGPRMRIVLDPASPGLAEEQVSGLFRADNAESFVRMLELSLGIRGVRRGDEILLRRGR